MIAQRPENNYLMLQTNCKLAALPRRSRGYEFHRLKPIQYKQGQFKMWLLRTWRERTVAYYKYIFPLAV